MKFTLSWLKDHLEVDAGPAEIAERLTMIGLEVKELTDPSAMFAPFTVGYVIEAAKHPNADRLSVCRVDTGDGEVQVVCGAPNARTGMKGVFAPAGVIIPGTGLALKKSKIRGVESHGMLLSERELGLSDDHDSIVELAADAPIGTPYAQVAGLDDPVMDVGVTPNRPDCLGVYGVARDLAAAGLGALKSPQLDPIKGTFASPLKWHRDFPDGSGHACPMVVGRYFRGVQNGPSPNRVQNRLTAVGLRPISALVDITNLVTLDLGRPLHVFDADKLAGDLAMRFARDGEQILALNEKSYELDSEIVVISDANAIHGIGGVMGGMESGCTAATVNVFLEVALFDPIRVAATGRRLGIESDARYRFERGLDPASALWGAEVAARLIQEFCGGEVSEVVVAGEMPDTRRTLALRPARVLKLSGTDVPVDEQRRILAALGFETRGDGVQIEVTVPSWRPDIDGEADLVEEIIRIWGFENVPTTALQLETALPAAALDLPQQRVRHARRALAGRGMVEAITWSFMSADQATTFDSNDTAIALANPISAELDVMRPCILPNLIDAVRRNADRGYPDIAVFEVGPQYLDDTSDGQSSAAAGVLAGRTGPRHWAETVRDVDVFDAKAAALTVLEACAGPNDKLQITTDAPPWYHPGRSGVLRLGPNVLACFGEIHPRILRRSDLRGSVAGFEVYLDAIPIPKAGRGKARPLLKPSPFQPVERDFAFVLDVDVPAEKVVRAAQSADKQLIAKVDVFDIYMGEAVGAGRKSLAINVLLQPIERTLTDAEIDAVGQRIIANVEKQAGGRLRA